MFGSQCDRDRYICVTNNSVTIFILGDVSTISVSNILGNTTNVSIFSLHTRIKSDALVKHLCHVLSFNEDLSKICLQRHYFEGRIVT